MRIKVLATSISNDNFKKILDYYNSHKEVHELPLEELQRAEGGFQIRLLDTNKLDDANKKIRQLRWSRGYLVSNGYIGFTEQQYMLLYDSLVFALSKEGVVLEGAENLNKK